MAWIRRKCLFNTTTAIVVSRYAFYTRHPGRISGRGDAGRVHASESARLGEANENRLEVWCGENGASSVRAPEYPRHYRSRSSWFDVFEHLSFVDERPRRGVWSEFG